MVTSVPDDVSGRVPTRSDLSVTVDPAHKCLKPLDFKLIGALEHPRPWDLLKLTKDPRHGFVASLISWARCFGCFSEHLKSERFIETQQLPACSLSANAATSYLPDAHHGVPFICVAASVNLNNPREAVVSDLQATLGA
jgi:hypothetical protein